MTLPTDDPTIALLDAASRERVGAAWAARSAAEGGAAENFRLIARSFRAAGAAQELIAIAERSVADELRHAELCRQAASAYLGRELALPPPKKEAHPTYDGAPSELIALLHVLGNCCYNETTATAYLELCLRSARGDVARTVLRALLSDDIDHARLGWSCLASALATTPSLTGVLSAYVLPLAKMNLRTWSVGAGTLDAFPEQGCPSREDVDATVYDSLRTLIFPGLARAGLEIGAALAWLNGLSSI